MLPHWSVVSVLLHYGDKSRQVANTHSISHINLCMYRECQNTYRTCSSRGTLPQLSCITQIKHVLGLTVDVTDPKVSFCYLGCLPRLLIRAQAILRLTSNPNISQQAVADSYHATCMAFGGVDIVVSNAGIVVQVRAVRAEPVHLSTITAIPPSFIGAPGNGFVLSRRLAAIDGSVHSAMRCRSKHNRKAHTPSKTSFLHFKTCAIVSCVYNQAGQPRAQSPRIQFIVTCSHITLHFQDVNFQGHVNVVGAAVRHMVAQRTGGALLFNVSSRLARMK